MFHFQLGAPRVPAPIKLDGAFNRRGNLNFRVSQKFHLQKKLQAILIDFAIMKAISVLNPGATSGQMLRYLMEQMLICEAGVDAKKYTKH
ncbi:hypothetical protein IWQ49_005302 [Labrenzia sp. EL_126]|nr:hypothetical protein [Labrenzia sp. EL_126]